MSNWGGVFGDMISSGMGAWWNNHQARSSAQRQQRYNVLNQANAQMFASAEAAKAFERQRSENRWMWDQQRKETKFWAKHGHNIEVSALRRAGLNPMLALGSNFAGAKPANMAGNSSSQQASAGSTPSSSAVGFKSEIDFLKHYKELALLDESIKNTKADTAGKEATKESVELDNSSKAVDLRQKEAQDEYRTGKKGWFWRKVLAPAKDYIDMISPLIPRTGRYEGQRIR